MMVGYIDIGGLIYNVGLVGYTPGAGKTLYYYSIYLDDIDPEFASVGLRVSGSHDPGEIACEIACYLWRCDI